MCSPCLAFLWDQGSGWGGGTWPLAFVAEAAVWERQSQGQPLGSGCCCLSPAMDLAGGAVLLGWQRLNGGCLSQPKLTHKIATQCVCLCVGGNQPAQGKPRWGSWAPSDA